MSTAVAKKTWTDGSGRSWTHGQLMRGWWEDKGRDPDHAPDHDCAGVLEMRGDRVIDDHGVTVVHWFGSFHHTILYCSACHVALDEPAYVAAVPREMGPTAAPTGGLGGGNAQPDLW